MRVYLINLDRSTERLSRMQTIFSERKIEFQRISAFDGSAFSVKEIENYSRQCPRPDGKLWAPGQIGCYLSHSRVWELIARGAEDRVAVFEDDVHVSADLGRLLRSGGWVPEAADIVRLETTRQGVKLGPTAARIAGRRIRLVQSESWGSAAYIVSKRAAERLVSTAPFYFAVDFALFNKPLSALARQLKIYQMAPAPCIQDQFVAHSQREVGLHSEIQISPAGEPAEEIRLARRLTRLAHQGVRFVGGRRRIAFR